jgi:outer membrane lipoprotein carrier protein
MVEYKMPKTIRLISVFCTLLVLLPVFLIAAEHDHVSDIIQDQYAKINSFQAEFNQELTNASSGAKEQRRGTIWYQQPQKIRWQTIHPEEELLISTGDVVWDYFPEEKTAYRYTLKGRFDSKNMLKFISGEINLKEDFQIQVQGKDAQCSDWTKISLTPLNPEPSLVMAHIWLDKDTNLIRQVVLVDFFGNKNKLTFEDIELNVVIDESRFSFDPPDGVEMIKR